MDGNWSWRLATLLCVLAHTVLGQGQGQQPPSYMPVTRGWSVLKAWQGESQATDQRVNPWLGRNNPLAGSNFVSLPYDAGNSNGANKSHCISQTDWDKCKHDPAFITVVPGPEAPGRPHQQCRRHTFPESNSVTKNSLTDVKTSTLQPQHV
jgi:hypothetical protein